MRWLLTLSISLATVWGCSLEDSLADAPCETNDDCLGNYACYFTAFQTSTVGRCRLDDTCAPGLQEGCIAAEGSCSVSGLVPTPSEPVAGEAQYCCPNPSMIVSTGGTEVQCVSTETEDIECQNTAACGAGYTCVRTLEQLEEPDELNAEDQQQEAGFCRPGDADTATCSSRLQEGCATESGCSNGLLEKCAGSRCYCCEPPANSNDFSVHVYAETSMGESAACVECPECDNFVSACTELEDSTCILSGNGPCGCMPEM